MADASDYVAKWLMAVGLEPAFAARYPHQFSGGQRQRVAIARRWRCNPRALLNSVPKLVVGDNAHVTFAAIAGERPSPLNPPPGCHFHLRCLKAEARCRQLAPMLAVIEPGQCAACHFHEAP